MLPPIALKYLLTGLEATPEVMDRLLLPLAPDDPRWDLRPDPERFTLREIVAHLADWDSIFLERMTRTRDEDEPLLEDRDEGQIAIDHDYAHSDPYASLVRLRQGRSALVSLLRSLTGDEWPRIGRRPPIGSLSLETQAVLVLSHDGYHAQQVVRWLQA